MLYSFFAGAACYADDVALLAPSPSTLRMMSHYCEEFAGSWGLIFNASKTQLICFGSQPSTSCFVNIRFFDAIFPFRDVAVHLDHLLCHDLSDSNDILCNAWDLIRKANLMLYTFSAADPVVKSCLLQSYC